MEKPGSDEARGSSGSERGAASAEERRPIVFFSEQRWDASDRARELSTRFAKQRPVVVLERPARAEPGVPDSWDLQFPMRRLLVGRPVLRRGTAVASPRLVRMIQQLFHWQDVGEWVAWLEAPGSLPLARCLSPRLVVYDRPSGPAARPADERPADAALVRAADVLFVGARGPWDGLAAHMLAELAKAERFRGRPSIRGPELEASG